MISRHIGPRPQVTRCFIRFLHAPTARTRKEKIRHELWISAGVLYVQQSMRLQHRVRVISAGFATSLNKKCLQQCPRLSKW